VRRERRKPTLAELERVIPRKRIPGKFSRPEYEWATARCRSALVTKTRGCLEGENLSRRGEGGR
jgi:hypothetical protein